MRIAGRAEASAIWLCGLSGKHLPIKFSLFEWAMENCRQA